jgi:3-phenylpropionate/trans-cinnamate dioxygenase ferredoxin reductase subunit
VAANTICGNLKPYSALPWFWSDQYDLKLQIAGLSQGYTDVVVRGDIEGSRSFAAFYMREGKLLAVDAVNRPQEFMLGKRLIMQGNQLDPIQLADESLSLKTLLAS